MHQTDPPPPYTPRAETNTNTTENEVNSSQPELDIPSSARRSIQDELRSLPENWIRLFDPQTCHQFFVDTSSQPPRSIWQHPYDDPVYLSAQSPSERTRIQALSSNYLRSSSSSSSSSTPSTHFPNQQREISESLSVIKKIGRKIKDAVTSTTHDERIEARMECRRMEQEAYRQHQNFRAKMSQAVLSGEPQLLGKDHKGRDIWIEAPSKHDDGIGFHTDMFGMRTRPTFTGSGENSFQSYSDRNRSLRNPFGSYFESGPGSRYMRPQEPYHRPVGGYSGGISTPLGLGLGGGMILGGLLF